MAKTSKGIYYPYDYNKIADVPEDMKQMAESINKIFETEEIDKTTQDTKIADLQNKLNEYNENAEDLISKVEQLQTENNELSNNMPWDTTSGKFLHITDSAKYSKNKLEISGDLEQEKSIEGKNKCKTDFVNWESGDYSNIDGSKSKFTKRIRLINLLKVEPNTTYYFNTFSDGYSFIVRGFDSAKTFTHSVGEIKNGQTYTTSNAEHYLGISIFNTNNYDITYSDYETLFNNSTIKPFICLDNEADKTFEEYIPNKPSTEFPSMPVVCTGVQKIRQFGENWFNKNNISKINAVFGTSSIIANSSGKSFYIKIEPDTYTISRKVIGSRFVVATTANIPKIGETIIERRTSSGSSITLTTSKNANYLVVYYLYNSSENEQEILDSIQIERGPKATKYKSYIEEINTLDLKNTELCAIKDINGNVVAKDRTVYRNGKWQWEKKIKKFVLKGTENFGKSSNTANISYYLNSTEINNIDINTIPNAQTNRDFVVEATCNYFRPVSLNTLFSNTERFTIDITDAKRIELRLGFKLDTEITTVALLKEWLAQKYAEGNPVTIYFILATPVYEDCTAEQSAILDKLYNNFTLQKGINNIIVETDNGVGVNMQLDYMQDLQTKLNLLEAMCVSNASQEV